MPRPTCHSDKRIYDELKSGPKSRRELLKIIGKNALHRRLNDFMGTRNPKDSRTLVVKEKRGREVIYSLNPNGNPLIWETKLEKPPSKKEREKLKREMIKRLNVGTRDLKDMMETLERTFTFLGSRGVQEVFTGLDRGGRERIEYSELKKLSRGRGWVCSTCLGRGYICSLISRPTSAEKVCERCGETFEDFEASLRMAGRPKEKKREDY